MASRLLTSVSCGTRFSHKTSKTLQHLCQVSCVTTKSPGHAQFTRDAAILDATTIPRSAGLSTGGKKPSKITVVLLPEKKVSEETVAKLEGDKLYLQHKFESCSTVKQVQKLLEKADLKGGLPLEATAIALYTVAKLEIHKSSQDRTLLSQDFFKAVCRKIVNNTGHLSTSALILSLESAYMFNMSSADYLPSALIAECTLRVTRGQFTVSELFKVGKFLGQIQKDLPILEEIAEDVVEKWEEVDEENISRLYRFLKVLPQVPHELRSILLQKTMSVTPRLSPHDISAVAKSLTQLQGNVNSLSIFLRLARYAYKYVPRYTDAELCDVLEAYIHFDHHDWSLSKALEQCVPNKVFTMHPSAVSKVMEYFAAKRVLSKPVFDAVAESFVYNAEGFSLEQIASQIIPYGKLNYLPPNTYRFLEKVEDLLMARYHLFPLDTMVNMLYSFACVGRIPLNFVNRVCSPYAEMQLELEGASGRIDKEIHKKLTQLMLAVELECPQFQTQRLMKKFSQPLDPQLPAPRFFDHPTMFILQQSLIGVLGGKQYLHHNVMLPSGYIADFEVKLDKEGHVLPYSNENKNEEDVEQRIVVCVLFPQHFCMDTQHLLGRQVMKLRHLKLLGYQVVQVPYFEFSVLKTEGARAKYIHQKLFPTTYKFSW